MSEENSMIYCSECGNGNPSTFKYCSNCGAKLRPEQQSDQEEQQQAAFERVDAEIVSEGKAPLNQEEININYGPADEGSFSSEVFTTPAPKYYSASSVNTVMNENESNGNIGFSIASMVCGILSMVCCCLNLVSLVLAIAAIVLGVIAVNGKYEGKGMAIAGIVTGSFGIVIWVLWILVSGSSALISWLTDI